MTDNLIHPIDVVPDATPAAPITAYADPEGEVPWAMQLVVHAEKSSPPSHTHTLEAAAAATVMLLASVEEHGTDAQRAAVDRWLAGRIRKVVRRARGAAWGAAAGQPGACVVVVGSAEVAAYLPGPVDQVPDVLRKLQVSGLSLTDEGHNLGEVLPDGRVSVYLNPHVALSTGKAAAQVAHAAQLVAAEDHPGRAAWLAACAPVTVVTPTVAVWEQVSAVAPVSITDAGFTEIPAGTNTCVAIHHL